MYFFFPWKCDEKLITIIVPDGAVIIKTSTAPNGAVIIKIKVSL